MRGWVKRFYDGSIIEGDDELVDKREVSWIHTKLYGMVSAMLFDSGAKISIHADHSEFWQSDDWEVSLTSGVPKRVLRRLQVQVKRTDRFIETRHRVEAGTRYFSYLLSNKNYWKEGEIIPEDKINQWFTVELDLKNGEVNSYYSKDRI